MIVLSKRLFFDYVIIILITSLFFGEVGGGLQPVRLLTFLFLPILIKKYPACRKYMKRFNIYFFFFISYCFVSLLWVNDCAEGLKSIFYNIIHFCLFSEILVFSRFASNPLNSISRGWLYAIICTLFIAVWELTTDNHLSMSQHAGQSQVYVGSEVFQRKFASITFSNYNDYVTFLCLSLPFVYFIIVSARKFGRLEIGTSLVILFSYLCILINASRGGLICGILMLMVFLFFQKRSTTKYVLLFFVAIISFFAIYLMHDILFGVISARAASGLLEDDSRFALWSCALQVLMNTFGFGSGVGNLHYEMEKLNAAIAIPHSLLVEFLSQYGIVLFIVLCIWLLRLFLRVKANISFSQKFVIYMFFLTFPVSSIIDATYLYDAYVVAILASLKVFSENYPNNKPFYKY